MAKYILKRLIHGLISIAIVVAIVMVLIYSLLERTSIFAEDEVYRKLQNNARTTYTYRRWQDYGYLDYVNYTDWLNDQVKEGKLDPDTRNEAGDLGRKPEDDEGVVAQYVKEFTDYYEGKGFTVERLKAITSRRKVAAGGQPELFAHKDRAFLQTLGLFLQHYLYRHHSLCGRGGGHRGARPYLHHPRPGIRRGQIFPGYNRQRHQA